MSFLSSGVFSRRFGFAAAILILAMAAERASAAASCESLISLSLPDTTITLAKPVGAGEFTPASGPAEAFRSLPGFCRVAARLKPTDDSDIAIEVWLPLTGWNGRFLAVGNGGFGGSISYPALAGAVQRGYTASSTDTGHTGTSSDASFALGHPEKVADFAWRSEHEMTVKAKAIVSAFYGNGPKLSFWSGCSGGGKQGLKEAQKFPGDFDGIVAGAPASNWTGRAAQSMWVAQAVHKDEGSYLPPDKFSLLHGAVLAACDARDGVKDGILEDPRLCKFDPGVLQCAGADGAACLTAKQVEAARRIYSPATNPRTGQVIFPGHERGSELGWTTMAGPRPFGIGFDHFRYVVFKEPGWDYKTFDFDSGYSLAEKVDAGTINALDPDLKLFFGHGGKLLQYHGWNDPQISPESSVTYYNSVLDAMGGLRSVQDSYRLFMAPGMAHCRGGEGPNQFDTLSALEQWVEKGKAPDSMIASRIKDGKVDRTRPLCPYPQVAVYRGSGSTDDAANFACKRQ